YIPKNKGLIAKIETSKIPLVQSAMKQLRCIFLDRKDLRQGAKAILEGIETLKEGYSLVVFPEGTRGEGGEMLPFKTGAFKLATKSKAPIVPVTIDGAYKIMPKNSKLLHAAEVDVTIHEPIQTINLTPEEEKELPQLVYKTIEKAITK
ncbi:MAG: 1-acyl-sn-glycerol-3-phosphate acyltransferase, partial [Defluviitaleaceae bacterium]|nr:1-acyl-sn-glycerol-3-phosphate acyltransferase [Defluviitaleaceae bacterium]